MLLLINESWSSFSIRCRFATPELGQRAIAEMQNYQIESRPIQVPVEIKNRYIRD